PAPDFIETTVSTYLEVLHAEVEDLTMIASVLWVEVVRRAAALQSDGTRSLAARFCDRVTNLPDRVGFSELLELEQQIRTDVFRLINSPYVELIFRINAAFARRHFPELPSARDGAPEHLDFVRAWRQAKTMELNAISDGDPEVAVLA